MDKIWYRNPSKSEVIGRCGGEEKPIDQAEPTKVERLKKNCYKIIFIKKRRQYCFSCYVIENAAVLVLP